MLPSECIALLFPLIEAAIGWVCRLAVPNSVDVASAPFVRGFFGWAMAGKGDAPEGSSLVRCTVLGVAVLVF
jgi:hypothetical protein